MSKTDKGVLIFNEWFEAMEKLGDKECGRLVKAIYRYQTFDEGIPEFTGKTAILADVIFPCIERRKRMSAAGKLGYKNKKRAGAETSEKSEENGVRVGTHTLEAKEKKSIAENSKEKNSKEEQRAFVGQADHVGQADLRAHPKRARGKYQNVFLSDKEYEEITRVIFNADAYIERFSEKLHVKGYRFESHFDAIMHWWEWDKKLPQYSSPHGLTSNPAERELPRARSDEDEHWDEFFDLAVKRSFGKD